MPHYSPDAFVKYAWAALVVVLIVVLAVVIILPATEAKSRCTGFQYFVFLSQKLSEDSYSMELLNGVSDIHVNSATVDGVNIGISSLDVGAGDSFLIMSARDPTGKKIDETFSMRLSVMYDIKNGINNNRDTAACTGRVQ